MGPGAPARSRTLGVRRARADGIDLSARTDDDDGLVGGEPARLGDGVLRRRLRPNAF
jgi:hypothetical protein